MSNFSLKFRGCSNTQNTPLVTTLVVVYLNMTLLQIYHWVCRWKNFENRLIFAEVMGKSLVSCFLTHGVDSVLGLIVSTAVLLLDAAYCYRCRTFRGIFVCLLVTAVHELCKNGEPIEWRDAIWGDWLRPKEPCIGRKAQIGPTWRIRLNDPCSMRPNNTTLSVLRSSSCAQYSTSKRPRYVRHV